MKRIFAVILSLCIALVCLNGCASNKEAVGIWKDMTISPNADAMVYIYVYEDKTGEYYHTSSTGFAGSFEWKISGKDFVLMDSSGQKFIYEIDGDTMNNNRGETKYKRISRDVSMDLQN